MAFVSCVPAVTKYETKLGTFDSRDDCEDFEE